MKWQGVLPAITTPFDGDLSIDFDFLASHVSALVGAGCAGIVALGSLGEAAALAFDEKVAVLERCRETLGPRGPLVAGIAALSTAEAVALAMAAERAGCDGLMVLPPYVYRGDDREIDSHFDDVIAATGLPCMLYNNPVAYGTDVSPERIARLAERHKNLGAVKESSADVRRVTAIRTIAGDRLALLVGVDDLVIEGIAAGATGWVAGLVNAFPDESVQLFDLAMSGRNVEALALYEWFLPLLRFDTGPKFVQLIKLVQQEVGLGSECVRPPRRTLEGDERASALATLRSALASKR